MLGMAQRRRFAGRPADDEGGRAFVDLPVAEAFESDAVEGPVLIKRRRDRRRIARQFRHVTSEDRHDGLPHAATDAAAAAACWFASSRRAEMAKPCPQRVPASMRK